MPEEQDCWDEPNLLGRWFALLAMTLFLMSVLMLALMWAHAWQIGLLPPSPGSWKSNHGPWRHQELLGTLFHVALLLPLAVGVNFLVNAKDVVVPMVVEEPSVVAAVSNMAKLVRAAGGFVADADRGVMIGQVLIVGATDVQGTMDRIAGDRDRLLALADSVHPRLRERGGGIVGMDVRRVDTNGG
jgi:hypothetical protein